MGYLPARGCPKALLPWGSAGLGWAGGRRRQLDPFTCQGVAPEPSVCWPRDTGAHACTRAPNLKHVGKREATGRERLHLHRVSAAKEAVMRCGYMPVRHRPGPPGDNDGTFGHTTDKTLMHSIAASVHVLASSFAGAHCRGRAMAPVGSTTRALRQKGRGCAGVASNLSARKFTSPRTRSFKSAASSLRRRPGQDGRPNWGARGRPATPAAMQRRAAWMGGDPTASSCWGGAAQ